MMAVGGAERFGKSGQQMEGERAGQKIVEKKITEKVTGLLQACRTNYVHMCLFCNCTPSVEYLQLPQLLPLSG